MPADLLRRTRKRRGHDFFVVHPRYSHFLKSLGVVDAASTLALRGEIISGHANRHVVRVERSLPGGTRRLYLKKEHRIGIGVRLRNRLDGFGPVSLSEREAETLQELETLGLPGPQWLAYGEHQGKAFLLVDDLAAEELRDLLRRTTERSTIARLVGRSLAAIHAAGFTTPELAAKHLFVDLAHERASLIDWQRSRRTTRGDAIPGLALLHATLADELASSRDRLRMLIHYRKACGSEISFRETVQKIETLARRLARRSSVRDQRLTTRESGRLVWLADEAVCVIPEVVARWPDPPDGAPFYRLDDRSEIALERITLANIQGTLVRHGTYDPLGRLRAALRERSWRSPAARGARILFHLQRHGIPGPKLLAFGQKAISSVRGVSFLLWETVETTAVTERLALGDRSERSEWLITCGQLLARLHHAGVILEPETAGPPFIIVARELRVASPYAVRLRKQPRLRSRRRDLCRLLDGLDLTASTDRLRLIRAYAPDQWRDYGSLVRGQVR